jgi:O-antigen ligase
MKVPVLFPARLPLRRSKPVTLMRAHAAPKPAEGAALFVAQFAAYVVLMGLAFTAQSGLIKALGNVYAVVIFGLVAFAWATRRHPPSNWATALVVSYVVYLTGIACSIAVNPEQIDWGDLAKIMLAPAFAVFGAAFERRRVALQQPVLWQRTDMRVMLAVLVVVPLLTWGAQLLQSGFQIDGIRETSIFANRNNAAVYAVTVLALVAVILGRPIRSLVLFMLAGMMFGTLGVLLAVVIALALTVARPRELLVLGLLIVAAGAGYFIWPEEKPFVRFTPVIDSIRYILDGRIKLHSTTFGELVLLLKTQDLSFVFRLKHWVDLMTIWTNADVYHWLFGFGVGSALRESDLRMVPHNDYLRLLFEFGLVTLAAFVAMLALVFARLRRRWETVPLLAVAIYLFSENLITNYTAMAFFFFSAGVLAERVGRELAEARARRRAEQRTAAGAATMRR